MKKVVACSLTLFSSIAVFAIGMNNQVPTSSNNSLVVVAFFVVLLAALIVPLPEFKSRKKDQKG